MSVEASSSNIFASSLLQKIEISPTHDRDFKYNYSQEIRTGPKKPGDISLLKIPKFSMCKHRVDLVRDRRKWSLNLRSPSIG